MVSNCIYSNNIAFSIISLSNQGIVHHGKYLHLLEQRILYSFCIKTGDGWIWLQVLITTWTLLAVLFLYFFCIKLTDVRPWWMIYLLEQCFLSYSVSNPGTEDHGKCLYLLESCFLYHFSIKPRDGGPWWVLVSIGILLSVPFIYQT